jgi:hypothetical protein
MNCTYKLKLDREYTFNSEEELNQVLQSIDVNEIIANPSKYRIENGKIVENTQTQLTQEQRQNIQELKQLEPVYAQASDEKVQEFLNNIYPDSKVKDVVWHGSFYTFDKFDKDSKNRTRITGELGKKAFYFSDDLETANSYLYDLDDNLLSLAKDLIDYFTKDVSGIEYIKNIKIYEELSQKDSEELTDSEINFLTDAEYFNINQRLAENQQFEKYPSYLLKYLPVNYNNLEELIKFSKTFKPVNKSKLYGVVLNAKNPVVVNESSKNLRTSVSSLITNEKDLLSGDSIIFKNVYEGIKDNYGLEQGSLNSTTYVVFEPEQITILNSQKTIQKFKEFIGKEQRIQSGTKTLSNYKSILDKLSKKFNIRYQLINNPNVGWKGKFENGVVFINEANFTDDTLFHEFSHPFIDAVRLKNKKLYESLKNEILNNDLGLSKLNQVKELYPELNEDEQIEETIVQLLGEYSAQIMNDMVESNSLFKYLKQLWNWIKNTINGINKVNVEELSPTMTIKDLTKLMLGESAIELQIQPSQSKYSKSTEQVEAVNKLNDIKVEKKDNTYIVNGKTKDVVGVNNFIDSELDRLKDADLGLVFNLENYRGALLEQERNKIANDKSIPDNDKIKTYREKEKEIDEKIAGFEKRTQLGSDIHLINEDVFNSEYVEDFKDLLDSLVNKHKDQFSNEYEAKKYISEIFNIKAKLYKKSKDKYGVSPVFVTEKKIAAPTLDGKQIAGTIDLVVINGNGSIDIYDWKTSKTSVAEWDDNKKKHVHFQLKMYEAMLNSLGFRVNGTNIIQLEVTNTDMKIDSIEVSDPIDSKTTVDNGVRIENQIATYYKTEKKERISKPVTNQINNFLKRAFNYEKKVVDTTVTNEEIDSFKSKMKDSNGKKTYFDNVANKTVEYTDDNQVKLYLEELRRYNANIRNRMIDFYKTYKSKGDAVYKVNNFNNEDKTLELKTLFDKFKDWELMEDDDVMVELDVFGFRNPRTNQVVFITVNPEREEQLELNFSKGYRVDIRENTVVANYSNKVTDSRLLKATTSNLQAVKAGLFTLLADKVNGEIEQVIVVSEKNSPQVKDLNTLQTNIKEIMKYDDFGFELKQKEFKTNKLNTLLDFYQQYTKQDHKSKQYSKTLDEIKKGKNNLEVLVKRQQEIINQFKNDANGLNELKSDTEFIMLNEAIAFLNNFTLEVEDDISKWGYYAFSGNRSSAETDAPNNIVNKLIAKVKELIDKAITLIRYDYEEKFFPEYAKIHKKLIDNSQSTLRQYAIGDTDEVYQNILEKEDGKPTMRIKLLSELQGVEREYAEYFMKQIDDVRKETMGVNYSKLTEEQKREIPLIKAFTNQAKGDWKTRIKEEWNDIFNVENLLSSDNTNKEKRADVANRFAYQESHREDVLLSGDKFETNLAYVLNTYMLNNMKRKRFNEVLPFINALKGIAFTANTNLFKDMSNVYTVIDSLIDTVIFNRTNFSKEDEVAGKLTSTVTKVVQDLAIGLSPMTSFVQGMIGIFGNTAFATSNKLFSPVSYGKAVAVVGSNNIKEIEFRDRLNSLYGIVSKDVDLLPKQNSFITTGLRAFGSRWLHWLNYMPDFFNRTSFVVAKMIEDGSYEAHKVVDGQLIYDETKDKRWFTNGKYEANNELLLMIKRLMKEEDGLDDKGNLKRAYTFKEIRSIKEYVNQVHGSYSKEDKIKFANSVFGRIFMQFKTWMRSKLDQWWKTYRVSDVVGNYQLLRDEQGNVLKDEFGMPLSVWVGTPEEGFLNTLMFMIVEGKYDVRKLEGWRKNNLKQGFTDLSIIALLALLSKLIDDDDEERSTAEYLVYKLGKDAFILNTVGSLYNANMPIASISYTSNMFASILNIPTKGFEPLIQQVGLARTAYNLVNAD